MTSASIPSRRTLNVQLGPAAGDEDVACDVDEPRSTQRRRTPRQRSLAASRIRWSRMAAPPGQPSTARPPPLEPPPTTAALLVGHSGAASLCQLVDFGETRDLIRRQRETAKQLEQVNSIVSHLSLDKENEQSPRRHSAADWATFRQQPNSQFKQYVFQTPGRAPALPSGMADDRDEATQLQHQQHLQRHQHHDQHQQAALQRSRTTLGLVSGRPAARHSRPEPLGAAALRRSESGRQPVLSREATRTSLTSVGGAPAAFGLHGYSSVVAHQGPDPVYSHFAHRKSKSFRLA